MRITSLFQQSFRSIWSNKARSSLTILGIVIGIAAVIALVGLGKGLEVNVTDRITNLGTTRVNVRTQDPSRQTSQRQLSEEAMHGRVASTGGGSFASNSAPLTSTLTVDDYNVILKLENVESASPEMSTQLNITTEADAAEATQYQTYGVDTDYVAIQDLSLEAGVFLSQSEVDNSEQVVVLGSDVAQEIFGGAAEAVGKSIYLNDTMQTVVGVVKSSEEASPFNNPADNIYTGFKSWLKLKDETKFSTILVNATSEDTVDGLAKEIESTLMSLHGVIDKSKPDFAVSTSKDLLNTVSGITTSFTAALAGIAGISLVVGGIGIMNIMLVTVTERTREIGLRRAVGAKTHQILLQFLIESLLLTTIGGVIGLGLGIFVSYKLGSVLNFLPVTSESGGQTLRAVVDVQTAILAVVISATIGVVFGLFPAIKAARLDPVEALRFE